jgi:RNA-directed DNA polymerase
VCSFDRIDHAAWLRKLDAPPTVSRQINAWLKAGVVDKGHWSPTTAGTPQGGVASPVFANIALHGLEELIQRAFPGRGAPAGIRYADDLVVLHPVREKIEQCQALMAEHLRGMGLEWKPSKTRITPTLKDETGVAGFDFLGFQIRQYPTKSKRGYKTIIKPSRRAMAQPQRQSVQSVRRYRMEGQARRIDVRNPMIRGWSGDFSTVCSKESFAQMDEALRQQLRAWSRCRHPNKPRQWGQQRYWRREDGQLHFTPRRGGRRLAFHVERPIRRHVKVQARRSPYDGDAVYWSTRRGQYPGVSTRVATLLKRQAGTCRYCGGYVKADDVLEVDHIIPRAAGGKDAYTNWQLLHR